jgi:hypothetical protein
MENNFFTRVMKQYFIFFITKLYFKKNQILHSEADPCSFQQKQYKT